MYNLLKIRQRYHFNVRVPKDLQGIIKLKVIRISLHTSSLRNAKVLAKSYSYKLEKIYTYARSGMMTDEQIQQLMSAFLHGTLRNLQEDRARGIGVPILEDLEDPETPEGYYSAHHEGCTIGLAECNQALITSDLKYIEASVDELLESSNIDLDKGSLQYKTFCVEMLKTWQTIYSTEIQRIEGNYNNDYDKGRLMQHTAIPQQLAPVDTGMPLSELIKKYKEHKALRGAWTSKTTIDMSGILNRLLKILGDCGVKALNDESANKYAKTLAEYPSGLQPKDKDKPITEILKIAKQKNMKGLHPRTCKKNLETVSSMMEWAAQPKYKYVEWNFFEGLAPRDRGNPDDDRTRYDIEDLQALLKSPIYTTEIPVDRPEKFFIPLIALFTGLRSDEICQLYCKDIKALKTDDGVIDYIVVITGGGKHVKTPTGQRVVPIHPMLKQIGLLEYVESVRKAGDERLWMKLKQTKYGAFNKSFETWWSKYNRQWVVKDARKVFHSFRHAFDDELKQQDVAPDKGDELMGHKNPLHKMRNTYTNPHNLRNQWRAIQALKYEGLDFSGIRFPVK